jgi:TniQ
MNRLLHRVYPYQFESAQGFFKRVANANYLSNSQDLLKLITKKSGKTIYLQNTPAIAYFCLNSVAEISQLSNLQIARIEGNRIFQINGQPISKIVFIDNAHAKICPSCLEKAPYIRGSWTLTFYNCCPLHRIRLIDWCDKCQRTIKWDRRYLQSCSCGADLRRVRTTPAQKSELILASLIDGLNPHQCLPSYQTHTQAINHLGDLSLDGICKTIWFLGHCISQLGNYGSGHGTKIPSPDMTSLMIDNAFSFLNHWPNRFGEHLDLLAIRKPSDSTDSLINRLFGPAQYYAKEALQAPELAFLKTAYEQHIERISGKARFSNFLHKQSKQLSLDLS